MKRSPKLLILPMIAALALSVTACTSTSASPSAAGPTGTGGSGILQQVLEKDVLRVGVQTEVAPWGLLNSDGSREGYDIALAEVLAESLGAKVEYVNASNETRIPLLQTDKVDVVIASFTATTERAQSVAFSIPYAATGTVVVVPEGSDIESYEDLAGHSVATSRGSSGEVILEEEFPDAEATKFESYADSLQALRSGKVEALIESTVVANQLVADEDGFRLVDADVLRPSLMSVGVAQGDSVWLDYVDTFVRLWNNSGQNQAATQEWLATDMPEFLK
ncbi:transporter substrate-binding domain-containing protein [Mycetocola sp. 2940]|uniref:transporter substrate-binding domain-containing protein n=1 Tax=Mycetocola sp. 2940 TaxID=3156452 RepID=UPI00339613F6